MGRTSKYTTDEERAQAQRENAKRWYQRKHNIDETAGYGTKNSYSLAYHAEHNRKHRERLKALKASSSEDV